MEWCEETEDVQLLLGSEFCVQSYFYTKCKKNLKSVKTYKLFLKKTRFFSSPEMQRRCITYR